MKQGVLEADTPRAVRDQLRAGGLTPTAVDAAANRARCASRSCACRGAARADHAAARDARAVRHAARPGAGRGGRAGRRRSRREARRVAARARRRGRGAALGARALSAHLLAAVSRARRGRRGNRAPCRSAVAAVRLPRSARGDAAEGDPRAHLPGGRHRHRVRRDRVSCSSTSCRRSCRCTSRAGRRCRGSPRRSSRASAFFRATGWLWLDRASPARCSRSRWRCGGPAFARAGTRSCCDRPSWDACCEASTPRASRARSPS